MKKGHKIFFVMRQCMCSEAREHGIFISILYLTPWDRLSLNLQLGWWAGHPSASPFFPPTVLRVQVVIARFLIWVLWLLLCRKCSYPLNHVPGPTNRILQLYKIFYTSSLKRTRKRIKLRPSNNLVPTLLSIWESVSCFKMLTVQKLVISSRLVLNSQKSFCLNLPQV